MKDVFFADFIKKIADFGLDLNFTLTGTTGAYNPFALSTEPLDTPEKQTQFGHGFWRMAEEGAFKVHVTIPTLNGSRRGAHDLIHELFHAWQDMHGFYFTPLQEQNTFPIISDAYSDIVAIMFNEAWAQTETIRTCWAIKHKSGDSRGWKGALSHPDFGDLAKQYDADLLGGTDETVAAANCFRAWYQAAHREFYERHALNIHKINFERYKSGAKNLSHDDITDNLRRLTYKTILNRIPKSVKSGYLKQIDWDDEVFTNIQTPEVATEIKALESQYSAGIITDLTEIKCGSPIYIWNRLYTNDIAKSEIPAEMLQQGQTING